MTLPEPKDPTPEEARQLALLARSSSRTTIALLGGYFGIWLFTLAIPRIEPKVALLLMAVLPFVVAVWLAPRCPRCRRVLLTLNVAACTRCGLCINRQVYERLQAVTEASQQKALVYARRMALISGALTLGLAGLALYFEGRLLLGSPVWVGDRPMKEAAWCLLVGMIPALLLVTALASMAPHVKRTRLLVLGFPLVTFVVALTVLLARGSAAVPPSRPQETSVPAQAARL